MTTTKTEYTTIGSRVPRDFAEQVRQAASAEDRTIGYLIRRAMRNELERTHEHVGGQSPTPERRA